MRKDKLSLSTTRKFERRPESTFVVSVTLIHQESCHAMGDCGLHLGFKTHYSVVNSRYLPTWKGNNVNRCAAGIESTSDCWFVAVCECCRGALDLDLLVSDWNFIGSEQLLYLYN